MGELREFIYLDDVSVNGHLSSMGRGIPSEIVQSTEGEKEKGADAGGKFMGIGAGGRYSKFDRDAIETTLTITAPYRFQDLLECLDDDDIPIHKNPDPRSLARGDVVQIEGDAKPMSLFKFEVAIRTIRELLNSDTQNAFDELDQESAPDDEDIEDFGADQLGVIQELMEQFTGSKLPLRFVTEDWSYGVALDRENMWMDPSRAFLEEDAYTLFGRVDRRILNDDSWDPILATNIISRYLPENDAPEEMRSGLEEMGSEFNIPTEADDWELQGHTALIQPFAVYW